MWVFVAVVGGLLVLLIVVLLAVVAKAVRRTTENATALMEALADVRTNTLVLADLEDRTNRVADDTAAAIEELRRVEQGDNGDEPTLG